MAKLNILSQYSKCILQLICSVPILQMRKLQRGAKQLVGLAKVTGGIRIQILAA